MNKKQNLLFSLIVTLMALTFISINSNAQTSPKAADMSIESVTVSEIPGKYVVEVTVRSGDNDSDSGGESVELYVVVPFPVVYFGFEGDAASCVAISNPNASVGSAYVVCDLDNMDFNSTKTVRISTSRDPFYNLNIFSAFAINTFPDPHPENNFLWGMPEKWSLRVSRVPLT